MFGSSITADLVVFILVCPYLMLSVKFGRRIIYRLTDKWRCWILDPWSVANLET